MIKKNIVSNYLGQGWSVLMRLAFIPLYIKFLGIESYGLIGFFTLLQVWFGLLDMGMTPTLMREMSRYTGGSQDATAIRDILRSMECIALVVVLLVAASVWLCSDWLAASWLQPENLQLSQVSQAIALMGLVVALRMLEGLYRGCILGLQRHASLNLLVVVVETFRGLGAVAILAWISPTIGAFFLWQASVSAFSLAALITLTYSMLARDERGGRFSLASLRGVWGFAGGSMSIAVLSVLLTQVDKVLLSRMLGLSDYGYYMLAAAVAGAMFMLINPLTQSIHPRMNELVARDDQDLLVETYHVGSQMVAVILGSAAVTLFLFSELILQLWTQDAELAARSAPLLSILVLGNLLNGLMWMPHIAQMAHGITGLIIRFNLLSVAIIIPAIVWVVPRYGAIGAAWVWLALNVVYMIVAVPLVYRRVFRREMWRWFLRDLAPPILAAVTVGTLARVLFSEPAGHIMQFLALLASGGAVLAAAALASPVIQKKLQGWFVAVRA